MYWILRACTNDQTMLKAEELDRMAENIAYVYDTHTQQLSAYAKDEIKFDDKKIQQFKEEQDLLHVTFNESGEPPSKKKIDLAFFSEFLSETTNKTYTEPSISKLNNYVVEHMAEKQRKKRPKGDKTLYEGDEGKIRTPNDMEASIKLGQNTQWCVSARDSDDEDEESENLFELYNNKAPIFMFIPTVTNEDKDNYPDYQSFKFAFCAYDKSFRDELDEAIKVEDIPFLEKLHNAHLNSLEGGCKKYYKAMTTPTYYFSDIEDPHIYKRELEEAIGFLKEHKEVSDVEIESPLIIGKLHHILELSKKQSLSTMLSDYSATEWKEARWYISNELERQYNTLMREKRDILEETSPAHVNTVTKETFSPNNEELSF